MEKEILEEIERKYNVREEFVKILIKICSDNNVHNIKEEINKFLNTNCQQ